MNEDILVMVIRKLKTAIKTYRDHGIGTVLRELVAKVLDVSEFVVMRRDMRALASDVQCEITFELKRIDDATLESFKNLPAPLPRHFEYRTQYGQRHCYGAYVNGKIQALMWVLFKEDNGLCVNTWHYLLADEAIITDVWDHPHYRGIGLIHVAMERIIKHLEKNGIHYGYEYTWHGNERAKCSYQKLNFHTIGKV